jgi:hypothetical protein
MNSFKKDRLKRPGIILLLILPLLFLLAAGCGGEKVTYYKDADGDSYGDPETFQSALAQPLGYVIDNTDCDDGNPIVYPGAEEIPNDGVDQDCNGEDASQFFADKDGDGYGDPDDTKAAKTMPEGYVKNSDDCNDEEERVYPGAEEVYDDGVDQNCNGHDHATYYADKDGDGFGKYEESVQVDGPMPEGFVYDSNDCDDEDKDSNPPAEEKCDGKDNNCNGTVDEGCSNFYKDSDGDGYGDKKSRKAAMPDAPPKGYVTNKADCNDKNKNIHPRAAEKCDGKDNNCNGTVDEGCSNFYKDADGDGYGDASNTKPATGAKAPEGYVKNSSDCDDSDASINPDAKEICNDNIDQDCSGAADDGGCIARVPGDYATIQKAIDSVTTGGKVLVSDGTYNENIKFNGRAVTVQSENGAGSTTIDGGGNGTVVVFTSGEGEGSVLDGFTITNGEDIDGGGIYCMNSSPTIKNCIITGNKADFGGGIGCLNAEPKLIDCTISDNTPDDKYGCP